MYKRIRRTITQEMNGKRKKVETMYLALFLPGPLCQSHQVSTLSALGSYWSSIGDEMDVRVANSFSYNTVKTRS